MITSYDKTDAESIDRYTEQLLGKTLRQAISINIEPTGKDKGQLGSLVERNFYNHNPPATHEPDFAEAGLELKVTGLKKLKRGGLTPKERLVLGMISYHDVVKETFQESYILRKIRLMLIVFYLYEPGLSYLDMKFLAKNLWRMPTEDMILIAKDWQDIIDKIKAGKAHELSEGDTLYLSACTKGATASDLTTQPFSDIKAMRRAFALKASYVRVIMETTIHSAEQFGALMDAESARDRTLEQEVYERLSPYLGKDVQALLSEKVPHVSPSNKSKYALLTKNLLGINAKNITEFEKAGILVRTIRVKPSGMPKEDVSFPAFDYNALVEQTWEDSDFKDIVERRFLFIVLEETKDGLFFHDVKFWTMPYKDRLEAERVWTETVQRIRDHRANDLPSKRFSSVAHVRPHGKNKSDVLPAPGGLMVVKKCFWLNASYIASQLG